MHVLRTCMYLLILHSQSVIRHGKLSSTRRHNSLPANRTHFYEAAVKLRSMHLLRFIAINTVPWFGPVGRQR